MMQSQEQLQLPRPISHIYFRGCSQKAQTELLARMPIHQGGLLSSELLQRTEEVAKAYDGRLEIALAPILSPDALLELPREFGVSVTIYDPALVPRRIRVEGHVQDTMSVEKVMPARHGAGVVQLAVVIAKDGTVMEVQPLTGPESLLDSAIDAVRRWRYRPTLLNGVPVEVQTTVEMDFATAPAAE